jgi:hypothetical protein
MEQMVSGRPLIAQTRVRSHAQSKWDLWWTKWHWNRLGFPCQQHCAHAQSSFIDRIMLQIQNLTD